MKTLWSLKNVKMLNHSWNHLLRRAARDFTLTYVDNLCKTVNVRSFGDAEYLSRLNFNSHSITIAGLTSPFCLMKKRHNISGRSTLCIARNTIRLVSVFLPVKTSNLTKEKNNALAENALLFGSWKLARQGPKRQFIICAILLRGIMAKSLGSPQLASNEQNLFACKMRKLLKYFSSYKSIFHEIF